jgi:beta-phosphoglucomutase
MGKQPPFALIFDLDGVLMNTHPAQAVAYDRVAGRFGFTPKEFHSSGTSGGSMRDRYQNLQQLRAFNEDFQTFSEAILEVVFAELEANEHQPDAGLVDLLEDLRKHGVPMAVGTSAIKHSALRKLTIVNLHTAFEVIVTANDVERHKPHPDVFLEAAKRLGVKPNHCIVIEDAEDGVAAARAAGMKAVGYRKHSLDPHEVDHADLVIDSFTELSYQTLHKLIAGKP